MNRPIHHLATLLLLAAVSSALPLRADDDGQEDLNKATEKKMTATSMDDLNEIINLTESALEKGLDDSNKEFANKMLASTLTQRGQNYAVAIFSTNPPDPRWPQIRQLALADLEKDSSSIPSSRRR